MTIAMAVVGFVALPLVMPFANACVVHVSAEGSPLLRSPSYEFLLGTDTIGRSEAVRLAYGVRTSLALALPATLIATTLAVPLGAAAAHTAAARRRSCMLPSFDDALSLVADVFLALPFVLVVAAAAAVVDDVSPFHLVGVMTLAALPSTAKLVRDQALFQYGRSYVHAAHAMGGCMTHVLAWHVAPRCFRFAMTLAPTTFAQLVVTEAALGYLGLGLPPPAATLGSMLADGQDLVGDAPWLFIVPCAALVSIVLAAGALARHLRHATNEADHG